MRLDKLVRPPSKTSDKQPAVDPDVLRDLAEDIWAHARNYAADRETGTALNPEVHTAKIRRELVASASLLATDLLAKIALSDRWKVELAGARAELAAVKKELVAAKGLLKSKRIVGTTEDVADWAKPKPAEEVPA